MIREATLLNKRTNESLVIGTNGKYVIDSIDWDSPSIEHTTYRVPFQIGSFYEGTKTETRSPSITGYVLSDGISGAGKTWEEYLKDCESQINENKMNLCRVVSPYDDLDIIVGEYTLHCRPTDFVKFSNKEKQNNEVMCFFTINLECYNPMFEKETKTVAFSETQDAFIFGKIQNEVFRTVEGYPLGTITNEAMNIVESRRFGILNRSGSLQITNDGDVEIGFTIRLKLLADSTQTFIEVSNYLKNKSIQIEWLEASEGAEIVVNTNVGSENAYMLNKDGTTKSLIGNVSIGSEYFKLDKGVNYVSYKEEEGILNQVEAVLEYTEQYANIEGM